MGQSRKISRRIIKKRTSNWKLKSKQKELKVRHILYNIKLEKKSKRNFEKLEA